MNKKKYTEADIENLYSHYKVKREIVDEMSYFHLHQAAKQHVQARRDEAEMSQILQMAKTHAYASNDSDTKKQQQPKLSLAISNWLSQIKDSFNPVWTGAGAAFASVALVAILLVNQPAPNSNEHYYISSHILHESDFVRHLLEAEQDWQHGFVSHSSNYDAFQSGVMVAGLMGVVASDQTLIESGDAQHVLSYLESSSLQEYANWENEIKQRSAAEIVDKIRQYYDKSDKQRVLYEFGIWLQYHYLLAQVALKNEDVSLFSESMTLQGKLIDNVAQVVVNNSLVGQNDFATLNDVFTYQQPMTPDSLRDFVRHLLKIKTLLINS